MLGEKLLSLRKRDNLTQMEVANLIGVSRQAYNNYENDRREPDYQLVKRFAEYFHVTTDYLLSNEEFLEDSTKKMRSSKDEHILNFLENNKDFSELVDICINLTPENRKRLLEFAQLQATWHNQERKK